MSYQTSRDLVPVLPHKVTLPWQCDAFIWCKQHLASHDWCSTHMGYQNDEYDWEVFHFRHAEDAVRFALLWS